MRYGSSWLLCVVIISKLLSAEETKPEAQFEINCKETETLSVLIDTGKTIITIKGGSGIGHAVIKSTNGTWPKDIALRVYLGGLENLTIRSDELRLSAQVLSTGEHDRLLHLWKDGKESPQLKNESSYWMDIRILDSEGKPTTGLPTKGGWFEMAIPKAMLKEGKELRLDWIDFYR